VAKVNGAIAGVRHSPLNALTLDRTVATSLITASQGRALTWFIVCPAANGTAFGSSEGRNQGSSYVRPQLARKAIQKAA